MKGATNLDERGKRIPNGELNIRLPSILLLPVFALLSGCASTIPPATTAVQSNTLSSTAPAMVTLNPDGTITVKKESSNGDAGDGGVGNGLVIPAQIILPTVRTVEKQQPALTRM